MSGRAPFYAAPRYARWPLAPGHTAGFSAVRLSVLVFRGRSKYDTWSHQLGSRVSRRARLGRKLTTVGRPGVERDSAVNGAGRFAQARFRGQGVSPLWRLSALFPWRGSGSHTTCERALTSFTGDYCPTTECPLVNGRYRLGPLLQGLREVGTDLSGQEPTCTIKSEDERLGLSLCHSLRSQFELLYCLFRDLSI